MSTVALQFQKKQQKAATAPTRRIRIEPESGPAARVLARLHGVRRTGDQWQARCPSHEDREPSLSIGEGNDGRALIRCHAGCDFQSIIAAIGLEPRDLFAGDQPFRPAAPRRAPLEMPPKVSKPPKPRDPGPWRETARYIYRDEAGRELYAKVRESSPAGKKRFRRTPRGVTSSLYRLEKLPDAAGKVLYLSESEKDADRLAELGAAAISTGGAAAWKQGITPRFASAIAVSTPRLVVLLPHNDEAGRTFADRAERTLRAHSLQVVVLNVAKPDSPEGFDVADWLEDGGTLAELYRMSELSHMGDSYERTRTCEEHRCMSPRWIGQRHRQTGHVRTLPGRCGRCLGCRNHFRAARLSRLLGGLGRWARVELVETRTATEYETLTRRLRRHGDTYVSIPLAGGARAVLTDAELGGEVLDTAPEALKQRLEAILAAASDAKHSRLDGSKNWEKQGERERTGTGNRAPEWERIGETQLSPDKQSEVFRSFECKPVRVLEYGRRGALLWSTTHLSGDGLEKLYWSLGFRNRYQRVAA